MTPEDFVAQVRNAVVEQGSIGDKDLLESASAETVSDPYWKRLLTLYHSLNSYDRNTFLEILRQIRIDTLVQLFCILDGVCTLENSPEDFELKTMGDGQKINGNLQHLFLGEDE